MDSISIFLVFLYVLLWSSPLVIGVIAYILLKKNKKVYICDSCGETFKFEQMEAKSCAVCGGRLVQIKSKDIDHFKYMNRIK